MPTLQNWLFWAFALTPSQCSGPGKEITYLNSPLAHSIINSLATNCALCATHVFSHDILQTGTSHPPPHILPSNFLLTCGFPVGNPFDTHHYPPTNLHDHGTATRAGVPVKSKKHDSSLHFLENQLIFVRFSKISENAREFLKLFLLKLFLLKLFLLKLFVRNLSISD
jgi:hypothetical protein